MSHLYAPPDLDPLPGQEENVPLHEALRLDAEKLEALTGEPQYFMVTCADCGGNGGFYTPEPTPGKWSDPTPCERWDECLTCHGSGWVSNHEPAPEVEQDEMPPAHFDGDRP